MPRDEGRLSSPAFAFSHAFTLKVASRQLRRVDRSLTASLLESRRRSRPTKGWTASRDSGTAIPSSSERGATGTSRCEARRRTSTGRRPQAARSRTSRRATRKIATGREDGRTEAGSTARRARRGDECLARFKGHFPLPHRVFSHTLAFVRFQLAVRALLYSQRRDVGLPPRSDNCHSLSTSNACSRSWVWPSRRSERASGRRERNEAGAERSVGFPPLSKTLVAVSQLFLQTVQ